MVSYLDLGDQPPSNNFLSEDRISEERSFPLDVLRCTDCGVSQLSYVVAATEIFSDYAYLASASRPLREHYTELTRSLVDRYTPAHGAVAVDVGANDGVLLNGYPSEAITTVAIEPSNAAAHAEAAGHSVINRFLDDTAVEEVLERHGHAKFVTATNVFAHIDDLDGATGCLARLLAADGVLTLEFSYLCDMIDGLYFDTVYHEHLSYLPLTPLTDFFRRHGLRVFDAQRISFGASGPALRVSACRDTGSFATSPRVTAVLRHEENWGLLAEAPYARFASRVRRVRDELRRTIDDLRCNGRRVGAYTAPAKGNTLLNYVGFDASDLEAIAETNERKIGKLAPGSHIPVISEQEFLNARFEYALLLAWNYAEFFSSHSPFVKQGGKLIVPLPEVRTL